MRLKETLKFMLHLFCIITTAQVIFISALSAVQGTNSELNYQILHSIMITAFVGVLPTIIFAWTENVSRGIFLFSVGLHFVLTTSFVFLSLNYFEMLASDNIIQIIIFFLVLYIAAYMIAEIRIKKTINELNKRINATHKD